MVTGERIARWTSASVSVDVASASLRLPQRYPAVMFKRARLSRRADGIERCSFCGKAASDGVRLIAGPAVFICNECVGLCNEILDEEQIPSE